MRLTLLLLSASSFVLYGLLILGSDHMKREFKRYNVEKFRTLTGYLEFAGGSGQLVGLYSPLLMMLASSGLALLMFLVIIIRLHTRDPWLEILPAIFLMLINVYLVVTVV